MADARNWVVAWDALLRDRPPAVEVGPGWPGATSWQTKYAATSGCCFATWHEADDAGRRAMTLALALQLVAEGVPVADVVRELAKTPEWGELLPPGTRTPGGFAPSPDNLAALAEEAQAVCDARNG